MIVELVPGIKSASGTLMKCKNGTRIIFTTRRAPSSNPCKVRMYIRTAEDYQRSTPVSKHEIQIRALFSKKKAWQIAKNEIKD